MNTSLEVCPVDLGITLVAIESLVNRGDTVWITATVQNLSSISSHNVTVDFMLPPHTALLQTRSSQGNYQQAIGLWNIGDLTSGQQVTLAFQLIIKENTLVEGIIDTSNQPDYTQANDQAIAHVAVDEASSGEDGGTESNGNLASKIASRKLSSSDAESGGCPAVFARSVYA